ncbi:hypothetical protein M432DRAFT_281091 [Thermoascus aurantiacus ATCC 26904]
MCRLGARAPRHPQLTLDHDITLEGMNSSTTRATSGNPETVLPSYRDCGGQHCSTAKTGPGVALLRRRDAFRTDLATRERNSGRVAASRYVLWTAGACWPGSGAVAATGIGQQKGERWDAALLTVDLFPASRWAPPKHLTVTGHRLHRRRVCRGGRWPCALGAAVHVRCGLVVCNNKALDRRSYVYMADSVNTNPWVRSAGRESDSPKVRRRSTSPPPAPQMVSPDKTRGAGSLGPALSPTPPALHTSIRRREARPLSLQSLHAGRRAAHPFVPDMLLGQRSRPRIVFVMMHV